MSTSKAFVVLLLIFPLGCATIISGTTQNVTVDTMNAKGARCQGTQSLAEDEDPIIHVWLSTPNSIVVKKHSSAINIVCKKKGFKDLKKKIDSKTSLGTIGNILLGGGIGILIDSATGANYEYPKTLKLPMEPIDSASQDEKKLYRKALKDVEIWKKQQEIKLQKEIESATN